MNALRHLIALSTASLLALAACNSTNQTTPATNAPPVGTYDGRAVVIAYASSDQFQDWMTDLRARQAAAKETGNQQLADEIEAEGVAQQARFHGQAFEGKPIDDVLAVIAKQLPVIQQQAGVTKLERINAERAAGTPTVDVTDQIVALFSPDARARGWIADIRSKPFEK